MNGKKIAVGTAVVILGVMTGFGIGNIIEDDPSPTGRDVWNDLGPEQQQITCDVVTGVSEPLQAQFFRNLRDGDGMSVETADELIAIIRWECDR